MNSTSNDREPALRSSRRLTGSYCPCPEVTINDNNRLLLVTLGKSQRPERPFISVYTTYKRQETLIEIAFSEKKIECGH